MRDSIYIVGTGGFAREVLFLLDDLGLYDHVKAFLEPDDIWEKKYKDTSIMDKIVLPMSHYRGEHGLMTIAVADPRIRELSTAQLPSDTDYITLIHPSAAVSRWSSIGAGTIITAGCTVTTQIEIGEHSQFNLNSTVGHDTSIGKFCTTAPAVNISGLCHIGQRVYFGTGSAMRQGISVCSDVTIGMGAMVVKDISEPGVYVGIPAKKK